MKTPMQPEDLARVLVYVKKALHAFANAAGATTPEVERTQRVKAFESLASAADVAIAALVKQYAKTEN